MLTKALQILHCALWIVQYPDIALWLGLCAVISESAQKPSCSWQDLG